MGIPAHLPFQDQTPGRVTEGQALIAATLQVRAFSKGPHIFNLGHGITPEAHPDNVQLMIDTARGT